MKSMHTPDVRAPPKILGPTQATLKVQRPEGINALARAGKYNLLGRTIRTALLRTALFQHPGKRVAIQ